MKKKLTIFIAMMTILVYLPVIQAQTTPLKEYGPYGETQSTLFLLEYLRQKQSEQAPTNVEPTTPQQSVNRAKLQREYPYRSERLTPGDVIPITFKQPLQLPLQLCLVGHDARSQQWLANEYAALSTTKTACAIVESDSFNANARLQKKYPDVYFYPMIADHISELHGLHHYPALITNQGIYPSVQAAH